MKIRQAFLSGNYKLVVAICGRGTGKSTIIGDYLFSCIDTMPRSRGWLGGPDEKAVKNRVLPSVQEHWERLGLIKDEDYVIGKKPPKDWDTPYSKVEDYKNIITFWNGATIDLVSFYSEGGGRGPSYCFGAGDEMGWVKRENFAQSIIPAMRSPQDRVARIELEDDQDVPFGTIHKEGLKTTWIIPFVDNPYYMSMLYCSSMPYLDKGKWLLDYEHNPKVYFIEGTALDNIEVVGADYVPRQQEALTKLEFDIEVMNKRLESVQNGFYSSYYDDKHQLYKNPYIPEFPILLGFDFGKFSGLIAAHQKESCEVFDNLYVKNGDIEALIEKFTLKYRSHQNKEVIISGDVMGNKAWQAQNSMKTWFEAIEETLRHAGWKYYRHHRYSNPPHSEKHLIIKSALQEKHNMAPIRIYEGCKALIMSMKLAPLTEDMKKDKKNEHPDSGTKQEEATHLSDAFDYLYIDNFASSFSYAASDDSGFYIG